jgi:MoaA/NifB/PqqE/SkfB family radical SAM enzyme
MSIFNLAERRHTSEKLELPRQLYLEVTNYCNSRCRSCPQTLETHSAFEPKNHLGWEQFRWIVDQVPRLERVTLHGIGEPLLNHDLPRFVAYLKNRGAYVLFNSNAILLDQAAGDQLVEAGLDELRVSIDAVTPELYARLRGVDRLPQVINNLQAFMARHTRSLNPRVSLWLVGMQANLHQLPEFIHLGKKIGVPEVYLQRLTYYEGVAGEDSTMTPEQSLYGTLVEQQVLAIRQCERLADELGLVFRSSGAATPLESISVKGKYPWQGCMRPWSLMYITANGSALPCCISPFAVEHLPLIFLGNVFSEPLEQVWNGSRYRELRAAVSSTSPAPWPCQFCGVRWSL